MGSANFLLNGSYVICSGSVQPVNKKELFATENFEFYRRVMATDKNNGIIGFDNLFLDEDDCVPYVNLLPFKTCQSGYYYGVMNELALHIYNQSKSYKLSDPKHQKLIEKFSLYSEFAERARETKDKPREQRSYPCVLELLDSWYNTDDKKSTSDFMAGFLSIKEELKTKAREVRERLAELRNEIHAVYKKYNWSVLLQDEGTNTFTNTGYSIKWKNEDIDKLISALKGEEPKLIETTKEELLQILEELSRWSTISLKISSFLADMDEWGKDKVELYKTETYDGQPYEDNRELYIDDVTDVKQEIQDLLNSLSGLLGEVKSYEEKAEKYEIIEAYNRTFDLMQEVHDTLDDLKSKARDLEKKVEEKAALTMNSYMVCRCGGIIRVVTDGQWIEISKSKIEGNVIDLLIYAEDKLYREIQETVIEKDKFSLIDAYNLIHGYLLDSKKTDNLTDRDYIINVKNEEQKNMAPGMKINIRPARDVLNERHRMEALIAGVTLIPFVGRGISIALAFGEILDGEFSLEEDGSAVSVLTENVILSASYELVTSSKIVSKAIGIGCRFVGRALNIVNTIGTCLNIYKNIEYQSHADFTGEITIEVYTFFQKFTFKGNYNLHGDREGEYFYASENINNTPFLIKTNPEGNQVEFHYKIFEKQGYKEDSGNLY